jgi:hypothetical protein
MSKKRASEVPLHQLDEKNTMRVEDDDTTTDPRELENPRGPPAEVGFGIKRADAATLVSLAAELLFAFLSCDAPLAECYGCPWY